MFMLVLCKFLPLIGCHLNTEDSSSFGKLIWTRLLEFRNSLYYRRLKKLLYIDMWNH